MRVCKRRKHTTMLTADELERYARHIVLHEVGGPGHTALKEASALVIGAGGLGALGMFDGSLTTIRAHERNEQGEFNPTYRCLFPEPPPAGTVPACAEAGVMGALAGILGSMMALEAIREIVGFGESLVGRLVMVDARAMRFETLRYARDPANPLNGDKPTITDLSGYAA